RTPSLVTRCPDACSSVVSSIAARGLVPGSCQAAGGVMFFHPPLEVAQSGGRTDLVEALAHLKAREAIVDAQAVVDVGEVVLRSGRDLIGHNLRGQGGDAIVDPV